MRIDDAKWGRFCAQIFEHPNQRGVLHDIGEIAGVECMTVIHCCLRARRAPPTLPSPDGTRACPGSALLRKSGKPDLRRGRVRGGEWAIRRPAAAVLAFLSRAGCQELELRVASKNRVSFDRTPWARRASCSRGARPERYATRRSSCVRITRDRRPALRAAPGGRDRPI